MAARTTKPGTAKTVKKSAPKRGPQPAPVKSKSRAPGKAPSTAAPLSIAQQVRYALASLEQMSTQRDRDNLARFGINANKALGVSMANMQKLARRLGRSHELAAALWDTGCYEARMLTAYVDEPARVTPTQMERWCRDFDNWAICDTVCFSLFDRTPHAWAKAVQWSDRPGEFVKRTAFVLMACLALHDKAASDAQFLRLLPLVEKGAGDGRNFVKKAVSWALRAIGRRNQALNAAAVTVSRRLAQSDDAAPRWVGTDALRELTSPKVRAALGRAPRQS